MSARPKIFDLWQAGEAHIGEYTVSDGMVHVRYLGKLLREGQAPSKYTQIGVSNPSALALILLGELVAGEAKKRSKKRG